MEPQIKISWQEVPNTVSERMIDSSLIHMLVPREKIRRRTKVLNNIIKSSRLIPSYSHYVKIKTNVLKEMSDDSDTDTEVVLGDDDFKRTYCHDTTEYNKSMSMYNMETLNSQSMGEGQILSNCEDYSNVYKLETSQYNSSMCILTMIPNAPTRVQPKRAVRLKNSIDDNKPEVTKSAPNNLVNVVGAEKHTNKNVIKKPKQKKVITTKVKVRKITTKGPKQQKNQVKPKNVQVRKLDHKNLGWQTIVKRKHMPRSIALPHNTDQTLSNENDTLNTVSIPNRVGEIQPSNSSVVYVDNMANSCVNNNLENKTINNNLRNDIQSTRDKNKALNVKKNLIKMWDDLSTHNPSYVQPYINNMRGKNEEIDLQNSDFIPVNTQEAEQISMLLSNNKEPMHHPKDSGIDDDSQEESVHGTISASSTKESNMLPMQEELVNIDIGALEEEETSEEMQDPLKLDELVENENVVNYDFELNQDQPPSETESFDPLGGIPDNSVTFADITRKPSESDDNTKPKVMCTEIVNKKYKIVPTQALKETNLKEQSPRALVVNSFKPLDRTISSCQLDTVNKRSEGSETHLSHESLISHQSYERSPSSSNSGNSRRSRSRSSSGYSASSKDTRSSHYSDNSRSSAFSCKSKDPDISNCESNVQNLEYRSDNEGTKSSRNSESSQDIQSTKSSKLSKCPENSQYAHLPDNAESSDSSDVLTPSRTLQNIKTTKHDTTKQKSENSNCCKSLNNSVSSTSLKTNKRSASPSYNDIRKSNKNIKCNTNTDTLEDIMKISTPERCNNLKCETLSRLKTLENPENLQISETPKHTEKIQDCNRIQQLIRHESPPITNTPLVHSESQDCKTETIAWIEEEQDDDNESNIMSPTTTRRLQQLKRLNLTTGSDSDSSQDETQSFHLNFPVLEDDSTFDIKSEKEEESSSENETEKYMPSLSQVITINNKKREDLCNNDWADTTACQGSQPDASSTVDTRKKKSKKHMKNLVEDETISHFSPITSINSNNLDNDIKSPSPTYDEYSDTFLPSSAIQSHTCISKNSLPLKKRQTSLGASTATPSEEDSLRYVLNRLQKKNLEDNELINCKELANTENHASAPETTMQGKKHTEKRPANLQQFIEHEELEEVVSRSLFKLRDISDDDEVFVLNIPMTVNLNNLQGLKIVMKKNELKIGKDRYEAGYKSGEPISCVIKTGKKRRKYKTVNIKPIGSIIVRRRISCATPLNTRQVVTEADCSEENTMQKRTKKKMKVKRECLDSSSEEIFMQNKRKRLKTHYDSETK